MSTFFSTNTITITTIAIMFTVLLKTIVMKQIYSLLLKKNSDGYIIVTLFKICKIINSKGDKWAFMYGFRRDFLLFL